MAHLKMNADCARSCTAKEHCTKLGLFKGKFGVNSGVCKLVRFWDTI